jgi:hypothetical protein
MSISKKDMLLVFLLASWFLGSVFWGAKGNPDLFQRFGAWGVAVSIFYYVALRQRIPSNAQLVDRLAVMRRNITLNSKHVEGAYRNAALTAVELKRTRDELGLQALPFSEQMEIVLREKEQEEPLNSEGFEEKMEAFDLAEKEAISVLENSDNTRERVQSVVAIVSTVQWGSGDLVVNFAKCGATSC